jgi:hypothetical protein
MPDSCDLTTSCKLVSTNRKLGSWKGPFYDNVASFHGKIHVSVLLSKRNKRFFGLYIRLYLLIDMSLSSEQHNTCKVQYLESDFYLHSNWRGPHGELCTASKLVWMGVNRPASQNIRSGMGTCDLEHLPTHVGWITTVTAGFEMLYKTRITVPIPGLTSIRRKE